MPHLFLCCDLSSRSTKILPNLLGMLLLRLPSPLLLQPGWQELQKHAVTPTEKGTARMQQGLHTAALRLLISSPTSYLHTALLKPEHPMDHRMLPYIIPQPEVTLTPIHQVKTTEQSYLQLSK